MVSIHKPNNTFLALATLIFSFLYGLFSLTLFQDNLLLSYLYLLLVSFLVTVSFWNTKFFIIVLSIYFSTFSFIDPLQIYDQAVEK